MSDGPCMDCGRPCPVWSADNDVWNETVGCSEGLLCPTCFMYRADKPKRIFDVTVRRPKPMNGANS